MLKRLMIALTLTLSAYVANLHSKEQPDLTHLSVIDLQEKMATGALSSKNITQYYLDRIEQLNPKLNAIISLNPDAIKHALESDELRRKGIIKGPLHGIPVLLKDNIDTKARMPNTAGSVLLKDNFANKNAFIVEKLIESGVIILGKTNLSEWANFRSIRSSSGWSGIGGQTRNPYDLSRSPCGSSSGSAVSVAANLAPLAVGTETDGSVTCPASVTSVVGIKPTIGLLSRTGIIPIANHQDTAGPMASSVFDAALLLDAMKGYDAKDSLSFKSQTESFASFAKSPSLKGKRIGIVRNLIQHTPEMEALFAQSIELLKKNGAFIVDNANIETVGKWEELEFQLLIKDFKTSIKHYLSTTQSPYKNIDDLIKGNIRYSEQELVHFGQELFLMTANAPLINDDTFVSQLNELKRLAGKEGIDKTLSNAKVDLLISPTTGPAWKIDLINGDHYQGSSASPAAIAGYPHITVPMGFIKHLPVGLSFYSTANEEALLIEVAAAFELVSQAQKPPTYLQSDLK